MESQPIEITQLFFSQALRDARRLRDRSPPLPARSAIQLRNRPGIALFWGEKGHRYVPGSVQVLSGCP
jgi:hypothetical protein